MRLTSAFILLIAVLAVSTGSFAREITLSTFNRESWVLSAAEEIVEEAYRRLGYRLTIRRVPGERSLIMANSGAVDGILGRVGGIEKDYSHLVRVPVSLFSLEMVVFTKDSFFQVRDWNSLAPYKVCYRRGIKAVEFNLPENIKTISTQTYDPIFLMLSAGRCDVVVTSRTTGMQLIDLLDLEGLSILEPPLTREGVFHFLNAKNRDLVAPLTEVFVQMEEEGLLHGSRPPLIPLGADGFKRN